MYEEILSSDNPELKAQAYYKIGRCFEKLGDIDKALDRYLMVIYGYSQVKHWFSKADYKAAELYEGMGKFKEAIKIYQKLIDVNNPLSEDAAKRISELRRKGSFIW